MKLRVLLGIVLLSITASGLAFAQVLVPTMNKLRFTTLDAGDIERREVRAANNSIRDEVVIPTHYNNRPVADIASGAFQNITRITKVSIPGSVSLIGANAFRGCTGLESVHIGIGAGTWIEANAFAGCTNLTWVTIGGWVEIENANAFPGDLRAKYLTGGAGAYRRLRGSSTWTKEGNAATCTHCWYSFYLAN